MSIKLERKTSLNTTGSGRSRRATGTGTVGLGSMLARFDNALKVKHKTVEKPVLSNTLNTISNNITVNDTVYSSVLQSQLEQQHAADLLEQQRTQQEQTQLQEQQLLQAEQQRQAELRQQQTEQAERARIEELRLEQQIAAAKQAEIDRLHEVQQQEQFQLIKQQAIEDEKARLISERNKQYQLKLQQEANDLLAQSQQYQQYATDCLQKAELHYTQRYQRLYIKTWSDTVQLKQHRKIRCINNTKRVNKLIHTNLLTQCYRHWSSLHRHTQRETEICHKMLLYRCRQTVVSTFNVWSIHSKHSKQLITADKQYQHNILLRTIHQLQQHARHTKQHKQNKQNINQKCSLHQQDINRLQLTQCFAEWLSLLHTIREIRADTLTQQQLAEQQRIADAHTAELKKQELAQQLEQQRILDEQAAIERTKQLQLLEQQRLERVAIQQAKQAELQEQQRKQAEIEAEAKKQKLAELEAKRVKREQDAKQEKQADLLKQQQAAQAELVKSLVADNDAIEALNTELELIKVKEQTAIEKHAALETEINTVMQSIQQVQNELQQAIEAEKQAEKQAEEQRILEQKRLKLLHVLFDPMVKKQKPDSKRSATVTIR